MTRRFLAVTVSLTASVGILVGMILAGSLTPSPARSAPASAPQKPIDPGAGSGLVEARPSRARLVPLPGPTLSAPGPVPAGAGSFADIAERLNPAVVSIDARSPGAVRGRRRARVPSERETPQQGTGTGFLIDAAGYILTNHHVVDGAERITVGLADGRQLRADRVGSDADTDIALIKIASARPLPFARLGNSDALRVGEWVVAIGNPLAYEHTVTVGIVSFLGRRLFESSLDRYIQTDAAINFGNSGGPLINTRGEVIGINAAISSRAANIGFAVPINQARAILPQLRARGAVSRGYVGVMLRDIDPDLQGWLGLTSAEGAIVQDVTPGSPGARAGVRPYDVILSVNGQSVVDQTELIQVIAEGQPGTTATLEILRDRRHLTVPVKLAVRPPAARSPSTPPATDLQPSRQPARGLGVSVRELDREVATKLRLPDGIAGVLVWRVDALGPASVAEVERGDVLLEINRRPVRSFADFSRITGQLHPGEVAALYLYRPAADQRILHTVRVE